MRISMLKMPHSPHTDLVTCVGWNFSNELYSCGDDGCIWRWNRNGEPLNKVCTLNACFIELQWYPTIFQAHQIGINIDVFVTACSDGSFHIISKSGREEKKIEAHTGVILSIQWNSEGSSLATSGEDGYLKIWSRNGILRSTFVHIDQPIYSLSWSPDSDQILFCCGKKMIMKPLQPSLRQIEWEGHDGLVLKVDWNSANNCILSAGEDCRYKIWDCYGRLLYRSSKEDFVITSVAWCPSGEAFAVGSFNSLLICDKTGWAYSKEKIVAGSILSIGWSMDGMQIAAAAGDGSVLFAQIVGRKVEWDKFTVTHEACNRIHVQNCMNREC